MDTIQVSIAGQVDRLGRWLCDQIYILVQLANVRRRLLLCLESIGLHQDEVWAPVLVLDLSRTDRASTSASDADRRTLHCLLALNRTLLDSSFFVIHRIVLLLLFVDGLDHGFPLALLMIACGV